MITNDPSGFDTRGDVLLLSVYTRSPRPPCLHTSREGSVTIVDDLWLAALTRDENNAGSKNRFNLTMNPDGRDVLDEDFSLGLIFSGGLGGGYTPGLARGSGRT